LEDNGLGPISTSSIERVLKRNNISWKMLRTVPAPRNSESTLEKRRDYARALTQELLDPPPFERLFVFLDEVGVNLNATRTHGRARKGQRTYMTVRAGRGLNYSVAACMTQHGMLQCSVQLGGFSSVTYAAFLRDMVIPLVRNHEFLGRFRHVVFVHDNVAFHNTDLVKAVVRDANGDGGIRFELRNLPPYSPFLNPIEYCFSIVKSRIRATHDFAQHDGPRAVDRIIEAFQSVKPSHCEEFFRFMTTFLDKCVNRKKIKSLPQDEDIDWAHDYAGHEGDLAEEEPLLSGTELHGYLVENN